MRLRLRLSLSVVSFVTVVTSGTLIHTAFFLQQHHHYQRRRQCVSSWNVPVSRQRTVRWALEDDTDTSSTRTAAGIYVHIPFCRRRCRYCNFAIVPIGSSRRNNTVVPTSSKNDNDNSSGKEDSFLALATKYTNALVKEIEHTILMEHHHHHHRHHESFNPNNTTTTTSHKDVIITSIYFGGGTPSLAPVSVISTVLTTLYQHFVISPTVEITMEMDPGTFSSDKLQALLALGITRISLGIQSFNDTILEHLGRVHRSKDIDQTMQMLQQQQQQMTSSHSNTTINSSNINSTLNYSLDLIASVPGLSLAQWTETLYKAISLQPPPQHLSIYDLQVERGTVFAQWYDNNNNNNKDTTGGTNRNPATRFPPLPSEEDAAFMYKYTAGYLKARGYEHYEVSSYAKVVERHDDTTTTTVSPFRSKHNQMYWATDGQWYAFGLGATSYRNGLLQARPKTFYDYLQWVDQFTRGPENDTTTTTGHDEHASSVKGEFEAHVPEELDYLMDIVLKRLRTMEGLSLEWVRSSFGRRGNDYVHAICQGAQLAIDLGLAVIEPHKEMNNDQTTATTLRLVDPKGFLFSNTIISSIFVELEAVAEKTER